MKRTTSIFTRTALACLLSAAFSAASFADIGSDDTPWDRRMTDATDLFGARIDGKAVNRAGGGYNPKGFDTFTPFQDNQQNLVGAYGATEVGVGCNGINLGTVLDGQIGQYGEMVEQFISNAPSLAIMYLAYSQPTVKAVIDQLNMVGQFGLDMSNMTCSGVRDLADKAYEEKKHTLAEADCKTEAGFPSAECMAGEGLTGSLIKGAQEVKEKTTARAGTLLGKATSMTGGLVKPKTGDSQGSEGDDAEVSRGSFKPRKTCNGVDDEGTTQLLLAASEMSCDDIKDYAGLLPSYSTEEGAPRVLPRQQSIEAASKKMTSEYMDLYRGVYASTIIGYQDTEAYKVLVNRADIVISDSEFKFMRSLATTNPAMFANAQRNLATMAMMKEMDALVGKMELSVLTGLANQIDNELISPDMVDRYHMSVKALRKEYELLEAKIKADIARNEMLQATYRSAQ